MLTIDLSGRRALVTGGDGGLGAAASRALAACGAWVGIGWRGDRAPAEALVAELHGAEGRVVPIHLEDVADPESVAAAFAAVDEELGGIDILVNNAGIDGKRQLCAESDPAAWRRVIEVDLIGPYNCAREAAKRMIAQQRGVIVNVTSVHETIPWTGYSAYTAAKAGLSMFTRTLAQEIAEHGVRVVAIAPGAIKTPINADVWKDPAGKADLLGKIPMDRIGEPKDVGRVIAFLASDLAGYVTGTTVAVDGGMLLYPGFREGG
ncbi:SDR family oxidoreductase [Rhizomicrobium electricum]|uniref:SDR family oxidoreductase n=1 Tax=Rhizomicrobium electricum TaxID=480070 RepID=A0ABP3Q050_9PROT|nr:SDR family oxidoreductase [Rhizomicrobium electricum]NIJ50294.1 glucose 1-dehydrogenase [Rhizomicrobium electricum]